MERGHTNNFPVKEAENEYLLMKDESYPIKENTWKTGK
jgi:hypothetical protein